MTRIRKYDLSSAPLNRKVVHDALRIANGYFGNIGHIQMSYFTFHLINLLNSRKGIDFKEDGTPFLNPELEQKIPEASIFQKALEVTLKPLDATRIMYGMLTIENVVNTLDTHIKEIKEQALKGYDPSADADKKSASWKYYQAVNAMEILSIVVPELYKFNMQPQVDELKKLTEEKNSKGPADL